MVQVRAGKSVGVARPIDTGGILSNPFTPILLYRGINGPHWINFKNDPGYSGR